MEQASTADSFGLNQRLEGDGVTHATIKTPQMDDPGQVWHLRGGNLRQKFFQGFGFFRINAIAP